MQDFARYPVAGAFATLAAVPLAFAPVVFKSYPQRCHTPLPAWLTRAADNININAPLLLHAYVHAERVYRGGTERYGRLFDGGLVDNFGLSGFTIALESAQAPYLMSQIRRSDAARLRGILFLWCALAQVAGSLDLPRHQAV